MPFSYYINRSYFVVGLVGASKARHGSFAINVAAIFKRPGRFTSCKLEKKRSYLYACIYNTFN